MSDLRASVDDSDTKKPERTAGLLRYIFEDGVLILDTTGDLGVFWADGNERWYLQSATDSETIFVPIDESAPINQVVFHRPGGDTEPNINTEHLPIVSRGVEYLNALDVMSLLDAVNEEALSDDSVTKEEANGVHAATYAIGVVISNGWPSANVETVVDSNDNEKLMRGRPAGMRGHHVPTSKGDLDFTCPGCGEVGVWSLTGKNEARCTNKTSECRILAFSPFVEEI